MSDAITVGIVAEGQTEFEIIRPLMSIFAQGRQTVTTLIQPELTQIANNLGPLGGGWKAVFAWCSQTVSKTTLSLSLPYSQFDVLIIQLDADIASDKELAHLELVKDCPPARPTCDAIRSHISEILGETQLPPKVVLCVPAQSTELWVVASVFPVALSEHASVECIPEPKLMLYGRSGHLVVLKDGKYRNVPRKYRGVAHRISGGWEYAKKNCPEAGRFESEVVAALSSS